MKLENIELSAEGHCKINCFANDGGEWSKKKITFIEKNWIRVNLDQKFKERTGRINCSLLEYSIFLRFDFIFTSVAWVSSMIERQR